MRVLPKAEREAMFAVYAFCRAVDDIADDLEGTRDERRAGLAKWRADIDSLYAGGPPGQAKLVASAVQGFGLAREDFHDVIDGMAMDVESVIRAPDAATLDLYCDRVASAVGRLSVRIFGMSGAPAIDLAYHLGRALQLTNILRDIDEDAEIGRLYLPRETLVAHGIAGDAPVAVAAHPALDGVARDVAALAHEHYAAANAVMASRPAGYLFAPRLMSAVYATTLKRMERTGWHLPRSRTKLGKRGLLWIVLKVWLTK
ncbi:presqualene diphosphate synthase HpnD [Glacieibacterium sp.]|uniref:presqualene diphosphate synthase HpnD n=1 Tax=Glacieibacterium sp. TaxID=2860237 RepID=UPI003B009EC4